MPKRINRPGHSERDKLRIRASQLLNPSSVRKRMKKNQCNQSARRVPHDEAA